jgi:3-carboxy-cis,cis-muconate cycloisomerase
MADAIEGLTIDPARMRHNIDATRGAIFAERVVMTITPVVGRAKAADMVKNAMDSAKRSGLTFAESVAAMPELATLISTDDIAGLTVPEHYLGAADAFRQRLIASATHGRPSGKR